MTGLRQGELSALVWDDIDFKNRVLKVNKTLNCPKNVGEASRTFKLNPPKTAKGSRSIPLTDEAIYVLKKQRKQYDWIKSVVGKYKRIHPIKGFENSVFMTRVGTPVTQADFSGAVRIVLRKINRKLENGETEFKHFTPHTFRHTFATRCFENGMQPKLLQELLGHSSLAMTMDLYTHVTEELKEQEVKKLVSIGLKLLA